MSQTYLALDMLLFVKDRIWGIDISKIAIDNCKIAFMIEYLLDFPEEKSSSDLFWNVLKKNFVCGDSTNMEEVLRNNRHFPRRFSCIIGNPPYVTLEKKGNLFIEIVNNMIKYAAEYSCSSLIVPLSVCYSQVSSFVDLRDRILQDNLEENHTTSVFLLSSYFFAKIEPLWSIPYHENIPFQHLRITYFFRDCQPLRRRTSRRHLS